MKGNGYADLHIAVNGDLPFIPERLIGIVRMGLMPVQTPNVRPTPCWIVRELFIPGACLADEYGLVYRGFATIARGMEPKYELAIRKAVIGMSRISDLEMVRNTENVYLEYKRKVRDALEILAQLGIREVWYKYDPAAEVD